MNETAALDAMIRLTESEIKMTAIKHASALQQVLRFTNELAADAHYGAHMCESNLTAAAAEAACHTAKLRTLQDTLITLERMAETVAEA